MADNQEHSLHENHRARMQERVARYGMESLAEHEVLEYLLYLSIPRQDTNPLAHRLIDHFGSFCRVMEATPQELMQVKGIGPRSAQLISDIMEFGRYYAVKKRKKLAMLDTTANAVEYVKPLFLGLQNEVLYVILMDNASHPLFDLKAAEGVPNHVSIDTRKLLRDVLRSNATSAILAHNHPTGPALPSKADQMTTLQIMQLLAPAGVSILDHIIVAGDNACSMADRGRLPDLKDYPTFLSAASPHP